MEETIAKLLHRPADSHKFSFGHVLVVGGSPGMVGAPLLAAHAALRSGAGLVTVASTRDVTDKLDGPLPELMTHAYDSNKIEPLVTFIKARKVSALVIGSGMVNSSQNSRLVRHLVSLGLPSVVDAGALAVIADDFTVLANNDSLVLTPHPGEFKKLLGTDLPEDESELKGAATHFAHIHAVTLVLKTHPTLVVRVDKSVYENKTGSPALATAGTGDVLAGMVAAIIAQDIKPFEAAQTATYLHGIAGELAGESKTEPGVIASDVIAQIPAAFKQALQA